MQTTADIRVKIIESYKNRDFVTDKTGAKMIELIGQSFLADKDFILREPNYDYIQRELEWYESESLYVEDIPGETPAIWKSVSSKHGKINSNYGYLIYSSENGNQYEHVLNELQKNPESRRAVMIYNRPSMHTDYCFDGMSDFVCTFANSFFIRNNKLVSHYVMRSNDAVFGYNNDVHWALYVQKSVAKELNVEVGDLIWTASSFHVYERHFNFIDEYLDEQVGC